MLRPIGLIRTSMMMARSFGATASWDSIRTSSWPSVFLPDPTAANSASRKLVLPALFDPMRTVRSPSSISTFASDRKLLMRTSVSAIPLSTSYLCMSLSISMSRVKAVLYGHRCKVRKQANGYANLRTQSQRGGGLLQRPPAFWGGAVPRGRQLQSHNRAVRGHSAAGPTFLLKCCARPFNQGQPAAALASSARARFLERRGRSGRTSHGRGA